MKAILHITILTLFSFVNLAVWAKPVLPNYIDGNSSEPIDIEEMSANTPTFCFNYDNGFAVVTSSQSVGILTIEIKSVTSDEPNYIYAGGTGYSKYFNVDLKDGQYDLVIHYDDCQCNLYLEVIESEGNCINK